MNHITKQLTRSLRRPILALAAVGMLFAAVPGNVLAAVGGGQVQYRSIKMSDNAASGNAQGITSGVGSGTNVTYRVTFRAASSYTIKGVVVDFCSGTGGTPFIGDSACPKPAAFNIPTSPTVDTTDYTYGSPTTTVTGLGSSWTASGALSNQTFKMENSTGTALTSGTDYTFAINGITNTSEVGTFYARLITYTDNTAADYTGYTHASAGNYQDYGGFAMSTAKVVQVTAKVQETLSFCVVGVDSPTLPPVLTTPPVDCTTGSTPAITLGHGTNNTLDPSATDFNGVFTFASTNALHGIAIRMRNSNACGGLSTDNGTTCPIAAVSAGAGVISGGIAPGNALFGMFCEDGNAVGPATNIVCDANYRDQTPSSTHNVGDGDAATWYGMDTTTAADNVTSTYGDVVAQSTAPVNNVRNEYQFAASASNITPAGIYRANLAMIATGTF